MREKKFDCVVLDLKLPDISGFDLLSEVQRDERRGIGDGKRAQQDRLHEAVDRSVGANPERQRQARQRGERTISDQAAEAIARVLRQLLDWRPGPQRAGVFAEERHVAKIAPRGPGRVLNRHSLGATLVDLLCQVKLQLLAQLRLLASSLQPPPRFPQQPCHDAS